MWVNLQYNGESQVIKAIIDALNHYRGEEKHVIIDSEDTSMPNREGLKFEGATVTDDSTNNQTVIQIPTLLSEFTNDVGFVTSTANNLVNYYLKSETYTQAEVNALISSIVSLNIQVVQALPTTDISTTTIYLLPKQTAGTQDIYDEYINTDGTTSGWEKIGSTEIDLTNYYTQSETDALLDDKVDKVTGKQLSTEDFTSALKGKLEGIEAGAQANVQADWNQTDNTADDYIKNKPTIPSGGDSVTWTQIQQTGQKIAEIDINGTSQDVYAPQGGGGSYTEGDGIDITNNEISVNTTFAEASTRANIASGDTLSTIWGKIKKFFSDLKAVAFSGSYNDLSDKPTIPTDFVSKANGGTFNGTVIVDLQNGNADNNNAWSSIQIGNNIPKGTAKHSTGYIRLYGHGSNFVEVYAPNPSAQRDIIFQDKSGTIALTSDIPDISTKVSKSGDTMSGALNIEHSGSDTPLVLKGNSANASFIAIKNNANTILGYLYGRNNNRAGYYYGGAYHDFAYVSDVYKGQVTINYGSTGSFTTVNGPTSGYGFVSRVSGSQANLRMSYFSAGTWYIYADGLTSGQSVVVNYMIITS